MKTTFKNQNKKTSKTEWIGKRDDSDIQDAEVGCIISVRVGRVKKCKMHCKMYVCLRLKFYRNMVRQRRKKKRYFQKEKKKKTFQTPQKK